MSKKHLTPQYQRIAKLLKPRLMAQLPAPCPRCGGLMERGMPLDLGHIVASGPHEAYNLRLEHRACNRRDGQRITTAKKLSKANRERMPRW